MPGQTLQRSVLRVKARSGVVAVLLLFSLLLLAQLEVMRLPVRASSFDIREHLSTKAPYIHRLRIRGAPSLYDTPDPPGYKPIFMYLLARHGSRWPTEKRMRQINSLEHLFKSVHHPQHSWMQNWTSPVADLKYLAGDLHPLGESEMMELAQRLRHRFPGLTDAYAPRRYPIISTQVPRAAQSASAFSIGFFSHPTHIQPLTRPQNHHHHQQQWQQHDSANTWSNSSSNSGSSRNHSEASATTTSSSSDRGIGGGAGHVGEYNGRRWLAQPVAINMLPKRHDPVLRFFESCQAYREHEDRAVRWLAPWMHRHWHTIVPKLECRLGVRPGSLNACHVDGLWQLCAFEAGLSQVALSSSSSSSGLRSRNSTSASSVCQLFTQEDAQLLEWLEDVRLYETQGYGAAINYEIAAPLLADIASALTSAARAEAAGRPPLQRARLMFAHCETLTPLASLMGLFHPDTQEERAIPRMPEDAVLRAAIGAVDEQTEQQLEAADGVDDLALVMLGTQTAAAAPAAGPDLESQHKQNQLQDLRPRKRRKLSSAAIGSSSGDTSSSLSSNGNSKSLHESTDSSQDTAPATAAYSSSSSTPSGRQKQPTQHQHSPEMEGCSYKGKEPLHTSQLLPPPEGWNPGFNLDDLDRVWRGGRIAPLGANLLLVLYAPTNSGSSRSSGSSSGLAYGDHRVRLVYNEQIIPVPGCGNGLDCSLDVFLRSSVGGKTATDRYKKHCDSEGLHAGLSEVAAGLEAQEIMYGRSYIAGSSSSSSSSSGYQERRWAGGLNPRETKGGLEFVTADGLTLLLAEELSRSQPSEAAHRIWY